MEKRYFCNICKKTISQNVFYYSINKYDKPLCFEHQKSFVNPTTIKLKNLVKKRHEGELTQDKGLESIEDWIKADFNKWESQLNKNGEGSYYIKENDNNKLDKKLKYHTFIKNKDKREIKKRWKIGGGK